MRCSKKWKVMVSAYADGELDAAQAAQVRTHLSQCPTCRELLQQWGDNQSLFTWAYSQQINEESTVRVKESPKVSSEIPEMKSRRSYTKNEIVRRSLAWAAVLVLCVLLGQFAVWSRLPSMGGEGSSVVTSSQIQKRHLVWGVTLNIGPNSQVMRTGPRSIKLIKGWVEASVTGRPIQVTTKRVNITDMGTRFEVGSGPQLDYVKVSKGWVWVAAGPKSRKVKLGVDDVMLVDNKQKPVVNHLSNPQRSQAIPVRDTNDVIGDTKSLNWTQCMKQMQDKYPGIIPSSSSASGTYLVNNGAAIYSYSMVYDLNSRVYERYTDILRGICGSGNPEANWSIPTAIFMLSGCQPFGEGYSACMLELVCRSGQLQWRLSDVKGLSVNFIEGRVMFTMDNRPVSTELPSVRWAYRLPNSSSSNIRNKDNSVIENISLQFWPGYLKPVLWLPLKMQSLAFLFPKDVDIKADVSALVAGRSDISLDEYGLAATYLNTQQTHYFVIYWNQLLVQQIKNNSSSSEAVVGVFTCTKPLLQPKLKAGTYTMRMKRTGLAPGKLYLAAAGNKTTAPQSVMLDANTDDTVSTTNSSSSGDINLNWGYRTQGKQLTVRIDITPNNPQATHQPLASGKLIIDNR